MAWSHIQSASAQAFGNTTTSFGATFGTNLSSGSVLLALISISGANPTSVTDPHANNFSQVAIVSGTSVSIWMLATPAADAGTAPTITMTFPSSSFYAIMIQEVSGISGAVDGTPGTATGTNVVLSPSYTSSAVNQYLLAVYGDQGSGFNPGSFNGTGYTLDPNNITATSQTRIQAAYKNSTGGAENDGWGQSFSTVESAILLSFKLGTPPPPTSPTLNLLGSYI